MKLVGDNPGGPEDGRVRVRNPRGPDGKIKLVTEFVDRIEMYRDTFNQSHFNGTVVI